MGEADEEAPLLRTLCVALPSGRYITLERPGRPVLSPHPLSVGLRPLYASPLISLPISSLVLGE